VKLYICNTPIHFPRSEYGGLVVVMAENKKQLGEMLTAQYQKDGGRYFDLSISVKSCKELVLDPAQAYQPGIAAEMLT
jgi:hypothetical protein